MSGWIFFCNWLAAFKTSSLVQPLFKPKSLYASSLVTLEEPSVWPNWPCENLPEFVKNLINLQSCIICKTVKPFIFKPLKITNKKEAKVASEKLLGMGIKKIVITLGEKGLFYSDGKEDIYLEANSVKVADTTGAGDAFNGGLAYSLSQNKPIKECLEFANKVAGASTTKQGAGDAMPFLKDLS